MAVIRKLSIVTLTILATIIVATAPTFAQQKPNILVIFGDDIGQSISAPTHSA
jgi:hypothetical protein